MMILCRSRIQNSKTSLSLHTGINAHSTSRYDFEYEDDDEQDTADVDVENKYYNAKQLKADNPKAAIEEFLGLPALEEEKGDWSVRLFCHDATLTNSSRGFKGLKQAIKLEFSMGDYNEVDLLHPMLIVILIQPGY